MKSVISFIFQVLFNLANQYAANEMFNEALNTYQVIVKNKMFTNAGKNGYCFLVGLVVILR